MKTIKYILKVGFLTLLVNSNLCAYSQNLETNKSFIQDTDAAARYFENELNFTAGPASVRNIIRNKTQNAKIIDLRREEHFNAGHIPGAINLPFDKWDGFEGEHKYFPGLIKNGYNYVYCYELLCRLGQRAAKKFASLGYPVKEMKGGFQSWKDHNYPTEEG